MNDPTVTASSTRAVSRCGVDTLTSTPQTSLNIHSFFGLFTRATTWYAELLLRQQGDDEVVLVVTGDGRHHVGFVHPDVAEGRDLASVAFIPVHAAGSRRVAPATTSRSLSMIVTSWPTRGAPRR